MKIHKSSNMQLRPGHPNMLWGSQDLAAYEADYKIWKKHQTDITWKLKPSLIRKTILFMMVIIFQLLAISKRITLKKVKEFILKGLPVWKSF